MRHICAAAAALLLLAGPSLATIGEIAGAATSSARRGPSGDIAFHYGAIQYTQAEIAAAGITSGQTINLIGFQLQTAVAAPATSGTIDIHIINDPATFPTPFTGSTAWSTITGLSGAPEYSGSFTIPSTAGFYNITLTSPIVYTGNSLIVAYALNNTANIKPANTTPTYLCTNSGLGNCVHATSNVAAPTTLTLVSIFRPNLRIGADLSAADVAARKAFTLHRGSTTGASALVQGIIRNEGLSYTGPFNVTAEILDGSSTVVYTQNTVVSTLTFLQEQVVSLPNFVPVATGAYTLNLTATAPGEAGAALTNNLATDTINVSVANQLSHANPDIITEGAGFTGGTGDFFAKYNVTTSQLLESVTVLFPASSAPGQPYRIGVWSDSGGVPGPLLGSSAVLTSATGLQTVDVNLAVNGTFYCGIQQLGTTNIGVGFEMETPLRRQQFYFTSPTGNTSFAELTDTFNFYIEPSLVNLPTADLAVLDIYTLTKVTGPNTVLPLGARINNNSLYNGLFDATVTVMDASMTTLYTNTVTGITALPATTQIVNFLPWTPAGPVVGPLTVTVSIPLVSGEVAPFDANNTLIENVEGTTAALQHTDLSLPLLGVGVDGNTADFATRFQVSTPTNIHQVVLRFTGEGDVFQVKIWNDAGDIPDTTPVFTSANMVSSSTLPIAVPVSGVTVNGPFWVGVTQVGTANLGYGYTAEAPLRAEIHYATIPSGDPGWDSLDATVFNLSPEPYLGPAPTPLATLSEGFDDIQTLPEKGWHAKNLSTPVGVSGWEQGAVTAWSGATGGPDSYVMTTFDAGADASTLCVWLVSPPIAFTGTDNVSFYTRHIQDIFPDRLQVFYAASDSINVGASAGEFDTGDFIEILDIDPTYLNSYPVEWGYFSVNVPFTGTGRLAFRYFVEDGGPLGSRSSVIGIDQVDYPAAPNVLSTTFDLIGAESRLDHGATTYARAIAPGLAPLPPLGTPYPGAAVEPRVIPGGGIVYRLFFSEVPIGPGGAIPTAAQFSVTSGSITGVSRVVNDTDIYLDVTVTGQSNLATFSLSPNASLVSAGGTPLTPVRIDQRMLIGDTDNDGDGRVNLSDLARTKINIGPTNTSTFTFDVLPGTDINTLDLTEIKARQGNTTP